LPFELIVMSMFAAPAGFAPWTVPGSGVKLPLGAIENPETVAVPAFDV
jgi:hypothetical protein